MNEMTKDELYARVNKAEAFIAREGYRSCSAAACNCGSWHGGRARELYAEIREVVQEAGVKTNGVLLVDALRDALARMAGPDEVVVPRERIEEWKAAVESWGAYASDYFKDKWDFAADVASFDPYLSARPNNGGNDG